MKKELEKGALNYKVFNKMPIVLFAIIISSCATSTAVYKNIDHHISQSDFLYAVNEIDNPKNIKRIYPTKNQILLYLDRGQLTHYAGLYDRSINDLQYAEQLIENAYTKSITQDISSYILNDNIKDYRGEDYEDIYLNVFNALNYYHLRNIDDALVEVRRTNEKLVKLSDRYESVNKKLEENYNANLQIVNADNQKPVNFSNSALADYLSALFYRAEGLFDDARISLLQLRNAYITSPNVYNNPIPNSLVISGDYGNEKAEELEIPKGMARLNILSFSGLSPTKAEEKMSYPLPFKYGLDLAYLRIPKLVSREDNITEIVVSINGSTGLKLELLEDMGKTLEETFKASLSNIILKTVIRTVVKYASVYFLAEEATKASGSNMTGALTALAAKAAFDASESADIRMERYLPAKSWVGAVNLPPGTYLITIKYYSKKGMVYQEEKNITIKSGALNLIESVYLK